MPTDWNAVSVRLSSECPSEVYRRHTIALLERIEPLGPLREPVLEFKRAYRFLHYNEPRRLMTVVQTLAQRTSRKHTALNIRVNAWNYVVATFDEWINHARIFYLVAGILEGALRSRLDARLTEQYGPDWPSLDEAVPSGVRNQMSNDLRAKQLGSIHRLVEDAQKRVGDTAAATEFVSRVRDIIVAPTAPPLTGAEFVSDLTYGTLRTFFQTKRLWGDKAQLQTLFRDFETGRSPAQSAVLEVFADIHDVRNDVAHYSPGERLSFANAFFAAAKLARWLDVDLQHWYSSIDTRQSTELSRLLGPHTAALAQSAATRTGSCHDASCQVTDPYDWLMSLAPVDVANVGTDRLVRQACLYHRVRFRADEHRPLGE